MCFPCWSEVYVEPKKQKNKDVLYYEPNAKTWVKLSGVKKVAVPQPPAPMVYAQPPFIAPPQPTYPAYQPPLYIQPQPYINGMPAFNISQPAYGTLGYTGTEVLMNNIAYAQQPEFNKKQEMKPADDDPLRMYWVREPDNTWTQRNRLTIDSGDIGPCRWYAMDGQFYAVRLVD